MIEMRRACALCAVHALHSLTKAGCRCQRPDFPSSLTIVWAFLVAIILMLFAKDATVYIVTQLGTIVDLVKALFFVCPRMNNTTLGFTSC